MPRGIYEGNKGKKLSEEHRKKISESNKGKKHTEETKKHLSKVHKGKKVPKIGDAKRGRKRSEETKQKIRNSLKGKWYGHKHAIDGPTEAEKRFGELHPEFEQEESFGTGKGGKKIWGCNFFKADFVDKENKIVYEIDGNSHTTKKERDKRKDAFFESIGYKVIRYTNEDVLQ